MHRNTARIRTFIVHRFLPQRLSSPILWTTHKSSQLITKKYNVSITIIPTPSRAYRIIKYSSREPNAAVQTVTGRGDLSIAVRNNAYYKERSHNTHYRIHVPDIRSRLLASGLAAENKTSPRVAVLGSSNLGRIEAMGEPVRIILLGDSMFERFKTKVPTSALNTRFDAINLGVGGDKIQNVLYRMSLGLLDMLQPLPIKLWVIHVGSNNLRPQKGSLGPQEVSKLWLMLRAILSKSSHDVKIPLCAIFERLDMEPGQVRESNELLLELVRGINAAEGSDRIFWQTMPSSIDLRKHLADNAHLNRQGYAIWDQVLSSRVKELID